MALIPQPLSGPLPIYLAEDGNLWAANVASGHAYQLTGTPVVTPGPPEAGGIPEAPIDGAMYGRQNGAWVQAQGIQNPPNDGQMYVRVYSDWVLLPSSVSEAPTDSQMYARKDSDWSVIRNAASDVPTISSISPNTAVESTQVLITVGGTNFTNTSHVEFMGYVLPTTFNSATELQATLNLGPGSSGTYDIIVVDMHAQSNAVQFTVTVT